MTTRIRLLTMSALLLGTLTLPTYAAAAKAAPKSKVAKSVAPKKAVCCVCAAKTGKKELEPVKASLKYRGKMYYFCNSDEKAEFMSNPSKYAKAVK